MARTTKKANDLKEEELNETVNSETEVVEKKKRSKKGAAEKEKLDVEDTSDLDRELEEAANKPKVSRLKRKNHK